MNLKTNPKKMRENLVVTDQVLVSVPLLNETFEMNFIFQGRKRVRRRYSNVSVIILVSMQFVDRLI